MSARLTLDHTDIRRRNSTNVKVLCALLSAEFLVIDSLPLPSDPRAVIKRHKANRTRSSPLPVTDLPFSPDFGRTPLKRSCVDHTREEYYIERHHFTLQQYSQKIDSC